jgi:DHA1 family chloramphenicol resistance protein-like MFS transporter
MPFSLYLLAVAVFAMGTSEFMLAGLVPDIATGLGVSVGTAGTLTSTFAVGMVVGAPLMASMARRWRARISLPAFLMAFAIVHVVGAFTTSFVILQVTRLVAAFTNAGFLAVALSTAATLVPAGVKGRALAVLLSGTTLATIAGVPGGALLGAVFGWRATFWGIALLCLPAALGIVKALPAQGVSEASGGGLALIDELAQLRSRRLVVAMVLAALVNAGTFATFTFLAPIVTESAGLGRFWVSIALLLFGVGSFLGVTVAGRLSDRRPGSVIGIGGFALLVGWAALAMLSEHPVALLSLVIVQGALSFAVGSTLIARVLYESGGAPTMGGAYATAALNIGAAAGPLIAAAVLGTYAAVVGPVWVSGVLVAVALLIALPFRRIVAPVVTDAAISTPRPD